jgi:undecaprenyl-diphosphatase
MDRIGVLLVNPGSGPDPIDAATLRPYFPGQRVEDCAPDRLAQAVDAAVQSGAAFVGVAGGDGSIRSAAERLLETETPLLPVPTGTRNHFSGDVGIETVEDAVKALDGHEISVDVGRVNGRAFVNNSSIGLYPKIVVRREVREHRLRKGVANVVATWEQLRHGRRITVDVDGDRHEAWLVFVGNGVYGDGLLDLADRESLDSHTLDLRVVLADRPLARLRVLGALFLGRLAASPLVVNRQCPNVTIDVAQRRVEVALDGEVVELEAPLRYESAPGALRVLVPR